ncbi:MAG: UDP-N-acetylglucosamine 4,6-dehydratase (inverting) [Acidobacteria bacterium]|nr:UDP-N-acetylglucosamine 4,6-dehydratase (inverting) [Acidobacteriota bacterium]
MQWGNLSILVTGGTGSFGKKFAEIMLQEYHPKKLIVFSRDELKQHEMRVHGFDHDSLRYFIGDVRDRDRLLRAMNGVDVVIHAAALKQVPTCEYNPIEAVMTNVMGAKNIIEAALDSGVKKVVALSTDKAVGPVNLYGATKLVAEKLFVHGNSYSGEDGCRFACVRYGNVVASRGSVIPLFLEQRKNGTVTVTDTRMTRFWITLESGVRFVINAVEQMRGGEVFIPKIPSMKITDLARALAPNCRVRQIGIRPGEKVHETLISEDEARNAVELAEMYIIQPSQPSYPVAEGENASHLPDGFCYTSDTNDEWLTVDTLHELIGDDSGNGVGRKVAVAS